MHRTPNPSNPKQQQPEPKTKLKIGISVVSCNTFKTHRKNQPLGYRKEHGAKSRKDNQKPLRSLSVERTRHKQMKMGRKLEAGGTGGVKAGLKDNLTQLEMQYDKLKLKRSLMTQRQSEKSLGKACLSDVEVKYVQSETKIHQLHNSTHLLSKCVPKSKINLLTQKYKTSENENNSYLPNESSKPQPDKQNLKRSQNMRQPFRERENSLTSLSNLQVTNLSESICTSNLSNLQVIPIGLNISLAKNKLMSEEDSSSVHRNQLYHSFHRKKGIKVLSSKKLNRPSLDSSVVSLEVMRQVQRKRSGLLQTTECPQQIFTPFYRI